MPRGARFCIFNHHRARPTVAPRGHHGVLHEAMRCAGGRCPVGIPGPQVAVRVRVIEEGIPIVDATDGTVVGPRTALQAEPVPCDRLATGHGKALDPRLPGGSSRGAAQL